MERPVDTRRGNRPPRLIAMTCDCRAVGRAAKSDVHIQSFAAIVSAVESGTRSRCAACRSSHREPFLPFCSPLSRRVFRGCLPRPRSRQAGFLEPRRIGGCRVLPAAAFSLPWSSAVASRFVKHAPLALTFADVSLVPSRSTVRSRSEVDTSTWFSQSIRLAAPLVSANMDTVTMAPMAVELAPFRCARNYLRSRATDSACLSRFRGGAIRARLPSVASALLHKCSNLATRLASWT